MSALTHQRCLVLNKGWAPISTVPLKRAIIMLFAEKARIIEPESYATFTWEDWSRLRPENADEAIYSANLSFRIPEIILLENYDKMPRPKVHFSRRNLYKRDNMTCQYCGKTPGSSELNIDHIIPRSKGGTSTWENCVLSCIPCNSRKANRTPEQAGMRLRKVPKKPTMDMFKVGGLTKPIKSWEAFLGEAYWNVEMKD